MVPAYFADGTEDLKQLAHESAPKLPRVALTAVVPDATITEQLKFSDTAMKRLALHLENLGKEEAAIRARRSDYSEAGFRQRLDALTAKFEPLISEAFRTIADAERVAEEQKTNHNRHARRARARFDRDPQRHAQISADARLRYASMPAVRLVEACARAAADNDLALGNLLQETIEARDDTGNALSRSQRAEAVGYLDRLDYGEREVELTFAKLEINALRAKLDIGIFPQREISRTKIKLGILQQQADAMEKALKARDK